MNKMKPRFGSSVLCLGVAAWLVLGGAVPARAGEDFSLLSAVPEDVFLCVASRHNPEKQFVEDYWSEVWQALSQSGITSDLMGLIGSAGGEEQQAEAQKIKDLVTQLLGQVEWSKLASREMVFAERLPELVKSGQSISVAGPHLVFLLGGSQGGGTKNFEGLVDLTNTLLGMAAGVGAPPMQLAMSEKAGAKVASLSFPPGQEEGASTYGLSIAQRDDVIVITLGNSMLDEVLGLLSGSGEAKPLVKSARFKAAMSNLPAAEDQLFFFDMQRFLQQARAITDPIFEAIGPETAEAAKKDDGLSLADQFKNTSLDPKADEYIKKAFKAYERKQYLNALRLTKKAHSIAPEDSVVLYNLACYNAILDTPDEALDWLEKAVEAGFHAPRKISNDADLASVRDDPRYKAALAAATRYAGGESAEDDSSDDKGQWIVMAKSLTELLYGALGMVDHTAAVGYTDGYSERSESICALSSEASQHPFYKVIGQGQPLKDYAKYLPAETTSFSVSSGINVLALYDFLEQAVKGMGPKGEQVLQQWAGLQEQFGINLRSDALSWLQGQTIETSLRLESGDASVHLIRVTDEAAAREKIEAALKFLSTTLTELAAGNPMMGMLAIRTAPATHEKLVGFQNIFMAMSSQPMVVGVANGFIILGSSEQAAALCLATAAGEHPNVTKNEQVMAEALLPTGEFHSVSFTDLRQLGAKISTILGTVQMVGGMASMAIPNPKVQQIVAKVMGMLGKLMPAAQKINFFRSKASVTTFDGKAFRTKSATNYVSPATRQEQPAG